MSDGYEVCNPIYDVDGTTCLRATYTPNNGIRLALETAGADDVDDAYIEFDMNRDQARWLAGLLLAWATHNHGFKTQT